MKVAVLGSGSRGNALAVATSDSALLIDAGFGFPTLSRRAASVGFDVTTIDAVILTHEHHDHAQGAATVAKRAACTVHASRGTLGALGASLAKVKTRVLPTAGTTQIGPFAVSSCPTSHDAAQPVAVVVRDGRSGASLGIAYDVGRPTATLIDTLRGVACLVLEANHDEGMLRAGPYPPMLQDRIAGPRGHLSNRAAADLASDLWHHGLDTIVLAHLSDTCNRPELARAAVGDSVRERGFSGRLLVAAQDEPLDFFEVGPSQYALEVFS